MPATKDAVDSLPYLPGLDLLFIIVSSDKLVKFSLKPSLHQVALYCNFL